MSSKQIINCPNCLKIYKKKGSYENHIFKCEREIENSQNKESIPKLFEMIEKLIENQNQMQLEISNLKANLNRKNKKINVLDWLNDKEEIIGDFTEDWKNLKLKEEDLYIIFDKGFVKGISEILNNYFMKLQTIKCFNEKKQLIYIYKNKKWQQIYKQEWEEIIKKINSHILVLFKNYQDQNLAQLEDEGYHKRLNGYLSKILCVELTFETKCNRIQTTVYNFLKVGFKNIVELQID